MNKVLYLASGVFDKGGISRYCRHQIRALRDTVGGDAVSVLSLLPPDAGGFEEPFAADFASLGATFAGKALFGAAAIASLHRARPEVVWCAHVGIAPLAVSLARIARATSVLNVYGVEVWTDLHRVRAAALRGADWVVSDCHNTRGYLIDHRLRPAAHGAPLITTTNPHRPPSDSLPCAGIGYDRTVISAILWRKEGGALCRHW